MSLHSESRSGHLRSERQNQQQSTARKAEVLRFCYTLECSEELALRKPVLGLGRWLGGKTFALQA